MTDYVNALKEARDAASRAVQAALNVDLCQQEEGAIWRHYQGLDTMYRQAKEMYPPTEEYVSFNLNQSHLDESPYPVAGGPVNVFGTVGQDVITFDS